MQNTFIDFLRKANKIVFFTGAGISCASGIPDFRSSKGLFKNNLNAEEILSHEFFMSKPKDFYDYYFKNLVYEKAKPNIVHNFITYLQNKKEVSVITQNIDGLHQKALNKNILELHGTIYKNHCLKCFKKYDLKDIINKKPPICECGGLIKPDVILYQEPLNEEIIYKSIEEIKKADCLIVLGTSLSVYPAASFINYYKGDKLVIINNDITPYDKVADLVIRKDLSDFFKELKWENI